MRRGLGVVILLCLLAAFLSFSCATSEQPRRIRDLSAGRLNEMMERKIPLVLVDTRTEYEYRQGHLPGAISIPPHRFDVLDALLPPDKGVEIVFYCRGFT
jgi:predicted sulfurtransferase